MIKAINVEIVRGRGRPLFYSINPLTIGADKFALIKGVAEGMIESEAIKDRLARNDALRAMRLEHQAKEALSN
jgi:hypothetical protein